MIYDVVIVGAGPCGLATAARLREKHPSSLFTDEEQARYSWIAKKAAIRNHKNGRTKCCTHHATREPSILVLDNSGAEWMTKWNALFQKFEIKHLRSPMFFHPDPSDRDALLAYVHESKRTDNMVEIGGCVGKEISKHKRKRQMNGRKPIARPAVEVDERDRKDYFAPSTSCFRDFCECCRDRYGLKEHIISQEALQDLDYDTFHNIDGERIFRLQTDNGQTFARNVVLATGGGQAVVPKPFPSGPLESASHAMALDGGKLIDKKLSARIASGEATHVLVIGGGLTSAQIADCLIRKGVSKVFLFMRGPWKVKPFDVDLSWLSKFRSHQKSVFWSAEIDERLEQVQEARNGGSMTPGFAKLLRQHMKTGRLAVHTHTTVASHNFSARSGTWNIEVEPQTPDLPPFDHIYFATGTKLDVSSLNFLQTMNRKFPIRTCGGLPALTDDLKWRHDVPLYMTGKLATLQLGPGAGNLEGARLGAERVAWAIEDGLQSEGDEHSVDEDVAEQLEYNYAAGIGSRFESLADGAEDND